MRIQLSGANYLALAEVEVFGPGEVFQLAQQVDVASTGLISNRQVTAASNVDGDAYDLATEYALGLNPYEVSPVGLLNLEPDAEENGMMQVWYERPARLGEIRYTLEYSADMVSWHSFPGGEVTSAGYGRERVTHRDLGGLHRGFVRLRVRNYDWNYESVTATQTWMETTLSEGFQTHGVSVSQPAILRSTIQNWDDSGVTVSVSNLQERFVEGQPYYMEITSGPLAGNRLDIDTESSTDSMIACDWSAPHNTLEQMPESSDWLGAEIALRPHWTMSQVYAKDAFVGGTVLEDADQVLFFNGVDYDAYFLLKADGYDQWTAQEDDALDSADSLIIPPGVGGFIKRPEGATPVSLVVTGEARSGAFIQPLSDGFNLLASPRPVDFDFTTRLLTLSDGFTGSRDPDTADQVQLWQGDAEPGKQGYDSYFLLDAGAGHQYWTEIGPDLPNVNASRLFLGDRAFFLKISGPAPLDYQLPAVIETPVPVID